MKYLKGHERNVIVLGLLFVCTLLVSHTSAVALDSSLEVSQYAHTSWTVREGFALGNIYAMAQTPDGYLWLGSEFGLFRFDGVRVIPWQTPAGERLPDTGINTLLIARNGSLWIQTFSGFVNWSGSKLTRYPELDRHWVVSLLEDHEGTVWAGTLGLPGRLCAVRSGSVQCYGEDGSFGKAVWTLYEDSSGTLWAGAESGLWRMRPGPPTRYATPIELIAVTHAGDGRLLVAMHGSGLLQFNGEKLESYPVRSAVSNSMLTDRDVNANKLLRDRDGGIWIGTVDRGLIHVYEGRTDIFRRADGLSGDVVLSLLEDREGNIWVTTTGGFDRFRQLPVTTISAKQGLSSDATHSVLAAKDGSIWIGAYEGLTRWKNGQTTIFRKGSELPDEAVGSLYQDYRGRIWVFTGGRFSYFKDGRFVTVSDLPGGKVHYITGDNAGHLWLSEDSDLYHLRDGRLVEKIPWSVFGRSQSAEVLLADPNQGGVWIGFWSGGGLSYFKDGQVRASYIAADGLGEGHVSDFQLDRDGALWAATDGGLSRIKEGRVVTLTNTNGLPCNRIHWSIEDDDRSFWLYTACGLVRIKRPELDAWIADPKRRIETRAWDAGDGVRLRSVAASEYGPRVAKSSDGKLWFVTGEGVQVVDPHHLVVNKLPPPLQIEQITADRRPYDASQGLRLPPRVRDVAIEYTALSFVAPEQVRFRYKLEGYDHDWNDAGNRRQAFYTNLPPRSYRFRVIASNNSGVWNEEGALLDFSIAPAFYQTNWFRFACLALLLILLWGTYKLRVRQLATQFNRTFEARMSERTRIARDLHDTLLQSFQGLLLRFQSASKILPARPAEAKQRLDSALDQAAEAIREGRDAVQGLRSSTFDTNDLVDGITAIAEQLTTDTSAGDFPTIDVQVEGTPRKLNPIVRDEAYRIASEALHNAFRHAQARRIKVEIRYDKGRFRLRVHDDGKGIDEETTDQQASGHFGLHGMRERAEVIGGRLEVWTNLGSGTEVSLVVPGAIAYGASARPAWYS